MSLRFHRTAPLITLYHDASSAPSSQALSLLRRAVRGLNDEAQDSAPEGHQAPRASATSADPPLSLATDDLETSNATGGGAAYLAEARLPPSAALDIQLEVRHKKKEPPTPSQVQTILRYLKEQRDSRPTEATAGLTPASASHPAATGLPGGALAASSGVIRARTGVRPGKAASEHKHEADWGQPDDGALVAALQKAQLLVVDWEGGRAATDLTGVRKLLQDLRTEQDEQAAREQGKRPAASEGCRVM
ncbi:unnamed protein product [Parajaminaea phylloscopi]